MAKLEKSEVIQLIASLAEYKHAMIDGEDDQDKIRVVGELLDKLFGGELAFTLDGDIRKPSDWRAVEKLTEAETKQLITSLETYIEGCVEGPDEIDGVSASVEIDALDAIIAKLEA